MKQADVWGPVNDSSEATGTALEDLSGIALKAQSEAPQRSGPVLAAQSFASTRSKAAVGICLPTWTTACAFEAVPRAAATQQKTPAGHQAQSGKSDHSQQLYYIVCGNREQQVMYQGRHSLPSVVSAHLYKVAAEETYVGFFDVLDDAIHEIQCR